MPQVVFIPGAGFPQRLARFIAENNLTYRKIQEQTRIAPTTIKRWRSGVGYPQQNAYYRFCKTYQINPVTLLVQQGEEPLVLRDFGEDKVTLVCRNLDMVDQALDNMNLKQLTRLNGRLRETSRKIGRIKRRRKYSPSLTKNAVIRSLS